MVINDIDKHYITTSINNFMVLCRKNRRRNSYHDLKKVMEKIELCVDNNHKDDITHKLPVYLASAKVIMKSMVCDEVIEKAKDVIETVEILTPPTVQYFQAHKYNDIHYKNNHAPLIKSQQEDEPCYLRCVLS